MRVEEIVDNERWLINNGLISDAAKNNIYVYAYLINRGIAAAEVDIDVDNRHINYKLFVKPALGKAYDFFSNRDGSWWSLLWCAFYVRKYGNLNFTPTLAKFIKDYVGPSWRVSVAVTTEAPHTEKA